MIHAFNAPCMEFLNPKQGLPLSEKPHTHLYSQIQQTSDIDELAKSWILRLSTHCDKHLIIFHSLWVPPSHQQHTVYYKLWIHLFWTEIKFNKIIQNLMETFCILSSFSIETGRWRTKFVVMFLKSPFLFQTTGKAKQQPALDFDLTYQ